MIRSRQHSVLRNWMVVLSTTGLLATLPLAAETVTDTRAAHPSSSAVPGLLPPPLPRLKSPVDSFRELLAMTAAERDLALTNRTPVVRARILAKVREYQALDPNERELRLRATELRWYMLPLLQAPPANRTAQLAAVPDELQPMIKNRLQQWDILPPSLQTEFLESEHALRDFTRMNAASGPPMPPMPPALPGSELKPWKGLSEDQRESLTAQVNQFFELTPAEKQKTLNTLSDTERQQMERALETFGQLPPEQRRRCVRAFTEFAGMSLQEKQDFLKNARRWSQMSPKERQTWRDLVTHVPEWPPLPSPLTPPMPMPMPMPPPPPLTGRLPAVATTNPN